MTPDGHCLFRREKKEYLKLCLKGSLMSITFNYYSLVNFSPHLKHRVLLVKIITA